MCRLVHTATTEVPTCQLPTMGGGTCGNTQPRDLQWLDGRRGLLDHDFYLYHSGSCQGQLACVLVSRLRNFLPALWMLSEFLQLCRMVALFPGRLHEQCLNKSRK